MGTSKDRKRRWQLSDDASTHPCRHCDRPIDRGDISLFEAGRPWIVLHRSCVESLAEGLLANLTTIEKEADGITADEVFRRANDQLAFLRAAETWGDSGDILPAGVMWRHHVKAARKKFDALIVESSGLFPAVNVDTVASQGSPDDRLVSDDG